MITSNTKYPFGGKVATVETSSFCCMISTAKEGIFQKQSVMFSDVSEGMQSRRHVAKLVYNNVLDSKALSVDRAVSHPALSGLRRLAPTPTVTRKPALVTRTRSSEAEVTGCPFRCLTTCGSAATAA